MSNERLGLAGTLGVTLFPVIGVTTFGWSLVTLLLLYWVEVGVVIWWCSIKALFAERASAIRSTRIPLDGLFEKRGGARLWENGPPIYPRNVPHMVGLLAIIGGAWSISGYSLFVLQGEELLGWTRRDLTVATVVVGAVGAFVTRGVEFWTTYLGKEEYRAVSAQAIAAQPATYLLAMWVFASIVESFIATGVSDIVAFVAVILVKLGYELYRYRTGVTEGRISSLVADFFGTREESAQTTIEMPDEDPISRFSPDVRTVGLGGLLLGLGYALSVHGIFILFPLWFLLQGTTNTIVATVITSGIVVSITTGKGIEQYIQYGSMEYVLYDGSLAGRDRRLDTPQWRTTYGEIETVTITRGLSGRLLGTGTVRLRTHDDRTITLAHLPDPEQVSDSIETRIW